MKMSSICWLNWTNFKPILKVKLVKESKLFGDQKKQLGAIIC